MCWCLAFVGSAPLFFTFESGRFQFPSREAMCLITFEDDTAFIIFSNVFYIATPFAVITVYCVKVFRTVLRSNRVFSHKNNPRRHRPNVEEAKVTQTLAMVLLGFASCWLPLYIMDFKSKENTLARHGHLAIAFLLYYYYVFIAMNKHFRRQCRQFYKYVKSFASNIRTFIAKLNGAIW